MAAMKDFQFMIILGGSVFGGAILIATIWKLSQIYRARNWLSAQGCVLKSEVTSKERRGADRNAGMQVGNYPLVEYEYEVAGRKYRAHRVDLGLLQSRQTG
jgi:hypothetical protein